MTATEGTAAANEIKVKVSLLTGETRIYANDNPSSLIGYYRQVGYDYRACNCYGEELGNFDTAQEASDAIVAQAGK